MRRILLLYIIFSVIGLTTVHAQFDNGRQRVDENGYDQYGNQVDPAMIPDRLDSANVEVQGLPPKLYMWRINNQLGDRTIIPADTVYHHFQNSNLTEGLTGHYNYLANMGSPVCHASSLNVVIRNRLSLWSLSPVSLFVLRSSISPIVTYLIPI